MASPFPFTAGQVLTAAQLNSIGDIVDYSGSATFGGVTVGNGTFTYANYVQINNLVVYQGEFVLGSTSAVTGNVLIGLPVNANTGLYTAVGTGLFSDTGTQIYPCYARLVNTTATGLFSYGTAGSYAVQGNANASTPFTWTTGDQIIWSLIYEAA